MKMKSPITMVLLLAGAAAVLTLFFLQSLRADKSIVIAARPIAVGARLTENDVKLAKVRSADALPGAMTKIEDAVGQVISVQRLTGDQVTSAMLGGQAISAISAALAPDHRAVAVTVTRSGGLAGIVRPGDMVTLIAVIEPDKSGQSSGFGYPIAPTYDPNFPPTAVPTVDPLITPAPTAIKPTTPFARVTATGLKVLLVPQTFRYQETTETGSEGFVSAQASQVGQSEGVIILDVPSQRITVQGPEGALTMSLPELIALLDTKATIYLALEPPNGVMYSAAPGIAIEQLVNLGVGGQP